MSIDVSVDAGIATLVLNRPDVLNALDLQAAVRLEDALAKAAGNAAVDGVVLTGAGRAFSAGGDLRWVTQHPDGTAAGFSELAAQVHRCIHLIRQLPKPVVAAVNGVAAGGGFSLALACDFRVLSETAVLRQAYTSAGLSIDAGGTHALPRLVG